MKALLPLYLFVALLFGIFSTQSLYAISTPPSFPVTFTDSIGQRITLTTPPKRVVSLVPSITEMLVTLGAAHHLAGVTSSATPSPEINRKTIVGSFLHPDLQRIIAADPDIIFYSELHNTLLQDYEGGAQLICLKQKTIEEGFAHLQLLGQLFNQREQAEQLAEEQKNLIRIITEKTIKLGEKDTPRTIRIMGFTDRGYMVPGDDSFQNEFIKAAGGIAPQFGQAGDVIPITQEQWQQFDPEVIYGCGKREKLLPPLTRDGWKNVSGVENNRIFTFPCNLTCRAATNMGDFISVLSAKLHSDYFSDPENLVAKEQILSRSPRNVMLSYVLKSEIINSSIYDFVNKTVLLTFTEPMTILSSLEGWRDNILHVGNHYFPPPSWGLGHKQGLTSLNEHTLEVLGLADASTALLFTGADMDSLAIVEKNYADMRVIALVTAGAGGNAVRMSADTGDYYELGGPTNPGKPGTINILLLTNTRLSPRAMTRSIISATEAKSAALLDLDIRSSYSPTTNPATGTGTDNIIVVQGDGPAIDSSGGHTKMGELMAKAVYEGVIEAISKLNGLTASRSVFTRLEERKIDLYTVAERFDSHTNYATELQNILLEPRYSGFIQEAMALSDVQTRGLVADPSAFWDHCRAVAREIGGEKTVMRPVEIVDNREASEISPVLEQALGALLSGIEMRTR